MTHLNMTLATILILPLFSKNTCIEQQLHQKLSYTQLDCLLHAEVCRVECSFKKFSHYVMS